MNYFNNTTNSQKSQEGLTPNPKKFLQAQIKESAIDVDLAANNLVSWNGDIPSECDEIFSGLYPKPDRKNTGALNRSYQQKYDRISKNYGYRIRYADPLTGSERDYMRVRFAHKIKDWGRGKPNSYKSPKGYKYPDSRYQSQHGKSWHLFFFTPTLEIWEKIANRYDLTVPSNFASGCSKEALTGAFWEWVRKHPQIDIWVVEGEKKALAVASQGFVAIAIPGIWMGTIKQGRNHRLHPELDLFCGDSGRRFSVCFDRDPKPKTITSVNSAARTLMEKLNDRYRVIANRVMLPSPPNPDEKMGIDDWIAKHGGKIEKLLESSSEIKTQQVAEITRYLARRWERHWQYIPDKIINTGNLCDVADTIYPHDLSKRFLLAIKSPKATQKTRSLIQWLKACRIGTIDIGCTNSLLRSKDEDFSAAGIPSLHIHDAKGLDWNLTKDPDISLHLCADSLHKISVDDAVGKIIILDEATQVVNHLFIGKTCKQRRDELITKFIGILKASLGVICLEAELSDNVIGFLASLGQYSDDCIEKIENTFIPKHRDIYLYEGSIDESTGKQNEWDYKTLLLDFYRHIEESLAQSSDKVTYLLSDSRKFCHANAILLQDKYEKFGLSEKNILLVTRDTIGKEEVQEFLKAPSEYLEDNKDTIKIVIASPTLQSGVSINNIDYFDMMFAFRFHVGTQIFTQMLGRVRDANVPAAVWSVPYLLSEESTSFSPSTILADNQAKISSEYKRLNIQDLLKQQCIKNPKIQEFEMINQFVDRTIAMQRYDASNLKQNLIASFEKQSAKITPILPVRTQKQQIIAKEYIQAKNSHILKVGTKILDADDIDIIEANQIMRSHHAEPDKVFAARKAILSARIPGILDIEPSVNTVKILTKDELEREQTTRLAALLGVIDEKDTKTINRLEMRWRLNNPDKTHQLRLIELGEKFSNDAYSYLPLNLHDWRSPNEIIQTLIDIGFKEWLDGVLNSGPDFLIDPNDGTLIEMAKKASHRSRSWLAGRMGNGSPIKLLNRILAKFGFRLNRRQKKEQGQIFSLYQLKDTMQNQTLGDLSFDLEKLIYPLIATKFETRLMDKDKSKGEPLTSVQQVLEFVQASNINSQDVGYTGQNPHSSDVLDSRIPSDNGDSGGSQMPHKNNNFSVSSVAGSNSDISRDVGVKTQCQAEVEKMLQDNQKLYQGFDEVEKMGIYSLKSLENLQISSYLKATYQEVANFEKIEIQESGRTYKDPYSNMDKIWVARPGGGMISIPYDWLEMSAVEVG